MLWTALLLGITGSIHCVGMCGPLVLALPSQKPWGRFVYLRLLYHGGRIVGYVLLGIPAGLIGRSISLMGWQRALSIILGAALLLGVIAPSIGGKGPRFIRWLSLLPEKLVLRFGHRFRIARSGKDYWLVGMLNGWLPCGLVYTAMAGAAASGSFSGALLYMALFGLGTVPMLFLTMFAGNWLGGSLQSIFRRIAPYAVGLIGLLLILRGLGLGIPFISPPAEMKLHNPTMV